MVRFDQLPEGLDTVRETFYTVSPGARGGWNVGDAQFVIGAAVPITWSQGDSTTSWFVYFSYELPFKK
jgi:hypothetical protein